MLKVGWEPPELREYDPEKHNPEKVFAFLCYRGIHYAKWVYLDINFAFINDNWNLHNTRDSK